MIKFNELNRHFYIRLFFFIPLCFIHIIRFILAHLWFACHPSFMCVNLRLFDYNNNNNKWREFESIFLFFISFLARTQSSLCYIKEKDLSMDRVWDNNLLRCAITLNVECIELMGIRYSISIDPAQNLLAAHRQNPTNPHIQTKIATALAKHWIKTKRIIIVRIGNDNNILMPWSIQ